MADRVVHGDREDMYMVSLCITIDILYKLRPG